MMILNLFQVRYTKKLRVLMYLCLQYRIRDNPIYHVGQNCTFPIFTATQMRNLLMMNLRSFDDEPLRLPVEACPEIGAVIAVSSKDICTSLYMLFQLLCKSSKKVTKYRYVGVCQSDIHENGEVRVQFLKTKHFIDSLNQF